MIKKNIKKLKLFIKKIFNKKKLNKKKYKLFINNKNF